MIGRLTTGLQKFDTQTLFYKEEMTFFGKMILKILYLMTAYFVSTCGIPENLYSLGLS
jgi:hypothetical protein